MRKLDKLTTNDMELALVMSKYSPCNFVKNQIVAVRCAEIFGHETDLVSVNKTGYATEVEIKISKADFKKDFDKSHYHESGFIKYFYYAVPYYMIDFALENAPEGVGVMMITPAKNFGRVTIMREAIARKGARKVPDDKILKMERYMGMRYWSLLHKVRKYFWDQVVKDYQKEQKEQQKRILNRKILKHIYL